MTRRDFIKGTVGAATIAGAATFGGGVVFLNTAQFGRKPSKERLARLLRSPNWKDGAFRNYEPLSRGGAPAAKRQSRVKVMWKFLFGDKSAMFPEAPVKTVKPDLSALPLEKNAAVWFGHSSVFLVLGGKRILIDPVFSPYASPLPFINRAFPYTGGFSVGDIPEIDILLVSHDHWDHLDYPTLGALLPKVRAVFAPLGVGEYLEQIGFDPAIVREGDWWDSLPHEGMEITFLPARHFSGRLKRPNQTLWCGFLLEAQGRKVLFSGDGGWGGHFAEIARRCGPVELAFLENGQYNVKWPNCHMAPEETALAGVTLGAKRVWPVHNCKFALSEHAWNAPLLELARCSQRYSYELLTPMVGEPVFWDSPAIPRDTFNWYA